MKTSLALLTLAAASVLLSNPALGQDEENQDCSATCSAEATAAAPVDQATQLADQADSIVPKRVGCPIIGQAKSQSKTTAADSSVGADCSACPTSSDDSCVIPADGAESCAVPGESDSDALGQVVKYLEGVRDSAQGSMIRLDRAHMEGALGFSPDRDALMEATAIVFPDAVMADGQSRCSDFGACSLYGDLSSATGETLSIYEAEKAEDGREFQQMALPSFTARTLDGQVVSSEELRGKPTLVVPLAVHCSHSYDTLPILHDFAHRYGPKGLRVVGLLINSGSPEDATTSLQGNEACHDFWVTDGDTVGKLLETQLVPSHFLVAPDGRVVKKYVGFKSPDDLAADIEKLISAS